VTNSGAGPGNHATLPTRALELIVAAAPLPIMSVDCEGCVTSWNPAAESMFGWSAQEVLGSLLPVVPAESREDALRIRTATEHGHIFQDLEVVRQRRDGSRITLSLSTAPLYDEHGRLLGTMFTYVDLTERLALEAELRARVNLMRQQAELLDLAHEAIFVRDFGTGVITYWGPGSSNLYGWSREQAIGAVSHELLKTQFPAPLSEIITEVEATGRWNGELVHTTRDGRQVVVASQWALHRDETGAPTGMLEVNRDITEQKRAEETLQFQAHHDSLTGLANRILLQDRLAQALARSKRDGEVVGMLFVDLDGFKEVNDRFGHDRGDEFLRHVARVLTQSVRSSDTVARLAGDEFVIILPNIASSHNAIRVAEKVLDALRRPVAGMPDGAVTASIGISVYPFDGRSEEQLLALADAAMYRAKGQGKNTYAVGSGGEA
jgi:diguanylate cyclase (GGDEF)-like protein/PAS domain S-box-containing protein